MKFTAEVTDKNASISFIDGTMTDMLFAVAVVVRGVYKSKDLDTADRFVFQMFIKDMLPDLVFESSGEVDYLLFLLKKALSEGEDKE